MSSHSGMINWSYLWHHMDNWSIGKGFLSLNLDTLGMSLLLGSSLLWAYYRVGRTLDPSAVPTRTQCAFELFIEFVDRQVAASFHRPHPWIAPYAFVCLMWIILMNSMSFVPPDFFTPMVSLFCLPAFKCVPTADLNVPVGLAVGAIGFTMFFEISTKGLFGFFKNLVSHPLPHWIFAPFNLPVSLLSVLIRIVSLSLRLFMNIVIGDLGYLGIVAVVPWFLYVPPHFVWSLFHLLVVPLQAFLFMTFTLNFISIALQESAH